MRIPRPGIPHPRVFGLIPTVLLIAFSFIHSQEIVVPIPAGKAQDSSLALDSVQEKGARPKPELPKGAEGPADTKPAATEKALPPDSNKTQIQSLSAEHSADSTARDSLASEVGETLNPVAPPPPPPPPPLPLPEVDYFADIFVLVGRSQESPLSLVLRYERSGPDKGKGLARFTGWIAWKGSWWKLEPEFMLVSLTTREHIPPHPAYSFSWPSPYGPGEWTYHFDGIFLQFAFNSLKPLYSATADSLEEASFYVSNATFRGQEHDLEAVLLHHRIHRKWRRAPEEILRDSLEFPSRMFFANARYGESFLAWDSYPFAGGSPHRAAVKLRFDGNVLSTEREIEMRVTGRDTLHIPGIHMGWNWVVPDLDLRFQMESLDRSPRERSLRLHTVAGKVYHDGQYQRYSGILFDHRESTESIKPPLLSDARPDLDDGNSIQDSPFPGMGKSPYGAWPSKKKKKSGKTSILDRVKKERSKQ